MDNIRDNVRQNVGASDRPKNYHTAGPHAIARIEQNTYIHTHTHTDWGRRTCRNRPNRFAVGCRLPLSGRPKSVRPNGFERRAFRARRLLGKHTENLRPAGCCTLCSPRRWWWRGKIGDRFGNSNRLRFQSELLSDSVRLRCCDAVTDVIVVCCRETRQVHISLCRTLIAGTMGKIHGSHLPNTAPTHRRSG